MPYAPGVQLDTVTPANNILRAGQAIADGIRMYAEKKQEREKEEAAVNTFQRIAKENPQLAQSIGISDTKDTGAFKAAVKAAGGADNALRLAASLDKYRQDQQELQKQKAQEDMLRRVSQYQNNTTNGGVGVLKPELIQRYQDPMVQDAASLYGATGTVPKDSTLAQMQENRTHYNKPVGLKIAKYGTTEGGKPWEVSVDENTGKELGRRPLVENKYVLTPDEQIRVNGETAAEQKGGQQDAEYVATIPQLAENAQAELPKIQQIRSLYSQGVRSGWGQDLVNQGGALAARMGWIKPQEQANREVLQKLLSDQALQSSRELASGQGAVSNYERDLFSRAAAEAGKTPEANIRILSLKEAAHTRNLAAEQQRQQLVDAGLTTRAVAEQMRRWHMQNGLDKYMPQDEQQQSADSAAAPTGTAKFKIVEIK